MLAAKTPPSPGRKRTRLILATAVVGALGIGVARLVSGVEQARNASHASQTT